MSKRDQKLPQTKELCSSKKETFPELPKLKRRPDYYGNDENFPKNRVKKMKIFPLTEGHMKKTGSNLAAIPFILPNLVPMNPLQTKFKRDSFHSFQLCQILPMPNPPNLLNMDWRQPQYHTYLVQLQKIINRSVKFLYEWEIMILGEQLELFKDEIPEFILDIVREAINKDLLFRDILFYVTGQKFNDVKSLLHRVVSFQSVELLKEIAKRTGNHVHSGVTLLHKAVLANNLEMVELILTCEYVDVNAKRMYNITPLHDAVMVGSLGIVLILLKNQANPFLTTVFGSTALDLLAKANGNLLAKGNHCGDQIRHAILKQMHGMDGVRHMKNMEELKMQIKIKTIRTEMRKLRDKQLK